MAYTDTNPVSTLLRTPTANSGGIESLVANASPQVQVVDWIFKMVTGKSLVQTIIEPIAGDWSRIAANGEAWRSASQGIVAIAENLSGNVPQLQNNWSGAASDSFANHITSVWDQALRAQAELTELIGKGLDTIAEEGKKLVDQIMAELEKLVNKLIEAIAVIWVPFAGWARAVQMVWDAFQLFQAIMEIIQAIQGIIEAAQALFEAVGQIKSAIESIPDVRSAEDALAVINRINAGVEGAGRAVDNIGRGIDAVERGFDNLTNPTGRPAPTGG
ncbi:MAG TPA: WXG100 family type VII secretion target [Pseudonocardiaceae bacterium]